MRLKLSKAKNNLRKHKANLKNRRISLVVISQPNRGMSSNPSKREMLKRKTHLRQRQSRRKKNQENKVFQSKSKNLNSNKKRFSSRMNLKFSLSSLKTKDLNRPKQFR